MLFLLSYLHILYKFSEDKYEDIVTIKIACLANINILNFMIFYENF